MSLALINTIGLFSSPVIAVLVTLVWQNYKEKRDRTRQRKEQLFLTMMAHRRSQPPSQAWVDSLNLIDVVFSDAPSVLARWHDYYDLLNSANYLGESSKRAHKHLELLSAMASELGYRELSQTDIDKYYTPVAHGNEAELNWRLRTELLRVLQATQSMTVSPSGQLSTTTQAVPSEPQLPALPQAPPNAGKPASESAP